jgi:hypothetical protein
VIDNDFFEMHVVQMEAFVDRPIEWISITMIVNQWEIDSGIVGGRSVRSNHNEELERHTSGLTLRQGQSLRYT